jgi:hypothetical protein
MNRPIEQTGKLFVSWQTSLYDGQSHAITDEEFTFGDGQACGQFEAVCGHTLSLADSFEAPGRRCRTCVAFLRARASMRSPQQRLNIRQTAWQRLKSALWHHHGRHAAGY